MASCDVQGTPSNQKLKAEDKKEVANKAQTVLPTKIPSPVRPGTSGNIVYVSNRKYTSLMKSLNARSEREDCFSSTSTLVNTTEDSGVQMDSSTADETFEGTETQLLQSGSSTPRVLKSTDTIATSASLEELELAERQTLKVLQRAVAEMEADVALHAEMLRAEVQKEQEQEQKKKQQEFSHEPTIQQTQQATERQLMEKEQNQLQSEWGDFRQTIEETKSFAIPERRHVRVEELLKAEHNYELLQQLLQTDIELANGDAFMLTQQYKDMQSLELMNTGIDAAMVDWEKIANGASEGSRKRVGLWYSLLQMICGKSIRKLSYPILFCGMAVGLIYYFRKD